MPERPIDQHETARHVDDSEPAMKRRAVGLRRGPPDRGVVAVALVHRRPVPLGTIRVIARFIRATREGFRGCAFWAKSAAEAASGFNAAETAATLKRKHKKFANGGIGGTSPAHYGSVVCLRRASSSRRCAYWCDRGSEFVESLSCVAISH